ncbi:MarR family winged helix-turn-helix transcriptional regulator [Anaerosalibacter bizertensis]|uniref:MarR family winged helix-turn-helix transcriptional regulator n=1 Tax=Anaerosalibacter bizertensis TaxID=932217 RepID=UPI003514630C
MNNKSDYEDIRHNLIKFMSLFHRLFRPTFKRETDGEYKCNKNQIRAIMIIGRSDKISPSVLCEYMDMEKGSITTLIDSMEKMGLVFREDDPKDKRKIWIQLTNEGKEYFIKQEEKFISQIEELFSTIPEKEVDEFKQSLKTIVTILDKIKEE